MVAFWSKMVYSRVNKISSILYKMMLKKHLDVDSSFLSQWALKIQLGLEELGMLQVWTDRGMNYDTGFLKSTILFRSKCLFTAKWRRELESDGFFGMYKAIKNSHGLSRYLVEIPFYERRAITRFISRCNFLPISDFRQYSDPLFDPWLDQRCHLCDTEVGDECHFLFRCEHLQHDRTIAGLAGDFSGTDSEHFAAVFHTENRDTFLALARFVSVILQECDQAASLAGWGRPMALAFPADEIL